MKILTEEFSNISSILQNEKDKLKNNSILITGANGLIASYLIEYLQYLNKEFGYNIKIYAMSRSMEKLKSRFVNDYGINFVEQDLNQPLLNQVDCDYIIHAASNAHPLAFSKTPVETMKTNLLGTISLLDLAVHNNAKFLYISTGEIYGNNVDHNFTENDLGVVDTKLARSCYPESKRAAETLCMSYNSEYNVDLNIARLCLRSEYNRYKFKS